MLGGAIRQARLGAALPRALFALGGVGACASLALGWAHAEAVDRQAETDLRGALGAVATALEHGLDGGAVAGAPQASLDAAQHALDAVALRLGPSAGLRVLRPADGAAVQLAETPDVTLLDAMEVVVGPGPVALAPEAYTPQLADALFEGLAHTRRQDGAVVARAPVRDGMGAVVGVVEATHPLAAPTATAALVHALPGLGVVGALLAVVAVALRPQRRDLRALAAAAEALSSGERSVPVPLVDNPDLSALAEAVEALRVGRSDVAPSTEAAVTVGSGPPIAAHVLDTRAPVFSVRVAAGAPAELVAGVEVELRYRVGGAVQQRCGRVVSVAPRGPSVWLTVASVEQRTAQAA